MSDRWCSTDMMLTHTERESVLRFARTKFSVQFVCLSCLKGTCALYAQFERKSKLKFTYQVGIYACTKPNQPSILLAAIGNCRLNSNSPHKFNILPLHVPDGLIEKKANLTQESQRCRFSCSKQKKNNKNNQ